MSEEGVIDRAQMFLDMRRPLDAIRILVPELEKKPDDSRALILVSAAHLDEYPGRTAAEHALASLEHALTVRGLRR